MEFSSALVDQLDTLSDALDDPVTDLLAILSVLTDDVTAAVPSFLGLVITASLGALAVTLGTIDSPVAGLPCCSHTWPRDARWCCTPAGGRIGRGQPSRGGPGPGR